MKKSFYSHSGFTLTEVLVSVAILSVVVLIGLALFSNNLEQLKRQEMNLAMNALTKTALQKIRFPTICTASLSFDAPFTIAAASTPEGIPIRIQLQQSPNVSIATGSTNIEGLNITSLRLTNLFAADLSTSPQRYIGLVRLRAEKSSIVTGGTAFRERILGALVIPVNSGTYAGGCFTDSSTPVTCSSLGGTYNANQDPPCTFPMVLPACTNANEYLIGFQNGVPVCQNLDGSCPAGQYLSGLSATGAVCSSL